jgi:ribonuclease P protein component
MREEDLSAEQPEAEEEARLPAPHAQSRRPRGVEEPPRQGPRPPVGLIWRVRDRATFRALSAGPRRRRGPLTVSCVELSSSGPPRVAYAIGRQHGPAVRHNRLRRRLRAAVHAERESLADGCAYLVTAAPTAAHATMSELRESLRAILGEPSGENR